MGLHKMLHLDSIHIGNKRDPPEIEAGEEVEHLVWLDAGQGYCQGTVHILFHSIPWIINHLIWITSFVFPYLHLFIIVFLPYE